MADPRNRIILPHDKITFEPRDQALYRVLRRYVGWLKANIVTTTSEDARGVTTATRLRKYALKEGFDFFWDLKGHEIPSATEQAAFNVAMLGSKFITFHASNNDEALEAAVTGLMRSKKAATLLAVTVLTSINSKDCVSIYGDKPGPKVVQFAKKALKMGFGGIVCSPQELKPLADAGLKDYLAIVTPGAQPEWMPKNDQKRVMTPTKAIQAGADYLVIGRAISEHESPPVGAKLIWDEIAAA